VRATDPAYPADPNKKDPTRDGLTKREYLAGCVMQGLLSNPRLPFTLPRRAQSYAAMSLELADALIAKLAEKTT
jgi:hypothetical protein